MKKAVITILMAVAGLNGFAQSDTIVAAQPDTTVAPQTSVPSTHVGSTASSREVKAVPMFGYLSYDEALKAMPQYAIVEKHMADLEKAYLKELKRVEDDFNQKYEAFLEGRKDFPRTILLKRQTELQQLLQQNVEFKAKSRDDLEKAREEALAPLRQRLADVISSVARKHRLALVVNTDANACPFIEPNMALNLNEEVRYQLRGR